MKKLFKPTYLCVKTHNVTGLKYFCKTTKNNYKSYSGSGIYWKRHLKEHGWDFTTELIGFYTNKEECTAMAIEFSIKNDIVNTINESGNKIWANQIIENGLDGGDTGRTNYGPMSPETKQKLSDSKKGQEPWNKNKTGVTSGNKRPRSEATKKLLSEANKGKKRDPGAIKKTADKLRGRKRPEISKALTGIKRSSETIEKMKLAQQNKGPLTEEIKEKIREKRKLQVFTDETRQKLKEKIVCISKNGEIKKIDKEIFYAQLGTIEEKEWVFHNSNEGKKRKMK